MKNKPQDITLNFIKDITTRPERTASFLGYPIKINKNVFPVDSPFSYSSKVTAKRIPVNAGVVLDIGTGTGVQAIVAGKRGAKKVIAIDIDDNCLENAKENIVLNKLDNVIEVRKSDLFNNIRNNEKFDLIISQLPFADVKYNSKVSHFLFDSNFKLHERLLCDAKAHLTRDGRILIPSGTVANEDKLLELIKKYNYKIIKVEEDIVYDIVWKLYTLSL